MRHWITLFCLMQVPFGSNTSDIGGGTYDPQSGILYLTVQREDNEQGTYANQPVVIAYQLPTEACVCCESDVVISTSQLQDNMSVYSSSYINSDAIVATGSILNWSAQDYIELIAPFQLNLGIQLNLNITDCNE